MEFTNLWMGFRLKIQLQCSRILCMPLQILQVFSNTLLSMEAIENIYPIFQTLQPVSQFQSAWPNRCPKMPLRRNSSSHNQPTTCSYQREIWDPILIWRGAWTGAGLQNMPIINHWRYLASSGYARSIVINHFPIC